MNYNIDLLIGSGYNVSLLKGIDEGYYYILIGCNLEMLQIECKKLNMSMKLL
jgi:hypothetical protein